MSFASGKRLGPYEIVSLLGAGGMGEVYRARDTRLSREVAIKVLPSELASDSSRLKRFEKEARSASALNHPNIVTVYDVGSEGGVFYIAMEMVAGETLRKLLVGGALSGRKLLPIAAQIAEGLAKAHEAGIVHRDLKPENVMVTREGLVKILDFGLARPTRVGSGSDEGSHLPTETATSPGMVVGTTGYMSPEQASGEPIDYRSDQFSLGSILYELATGKRAFLKKTGVDTLGAILNEEPEPIARINPKVSQPFHWIVDRCLAKDPEGRYASTKDLARDLGALRDHLADGYFISGTLAPDSPGVQGRPLWMLIAVVVAATSLVCGVAGWILLRRVAERPPPSFRQLTFRRGQILSARFAPDGQILYSAAWDGKPMEIFVGRPEVPESRLFGLLYAELLALSSSGQLAVSLGRFAAGAYRRSGTLAQVPLAGGTAPREIMRNIEWADWSPDGKSLAIVRQSREKTRLEFPAGKTLYETNGWIGNPRVSPDGSRVAFIDHPTLNDDGGSIAAVDLSGHVQTLSETFASAQGLAWSPEGEIWFTASRVGLNRRLSSTSLVGTVRERVRVPGSLILEDISRDGRYLVTRDTMRYEIVALAPGETKERDLSWLDYPAPAGMSADGKKVLFSETGEGGGAGFSVYIRSTDGSPAVRLGEGLAQDLSPDGQWALAIAYPDSGPQLVVYSTGAGETRVFPKEGLRIQRAKWMPDGRQVLLTASEQGHAPRIYLWTVGGGRPRPVVPEGYTGGSIVAPDGEWTIVAGAGRIYRYPLSGGEPIAIPGLEPGDAVDQFTRDGRSVYVHQVGEMPARVFRLDLATGRKQLWRNLMPADVAGVPEIHPIPTPDGDGYLYSFDRTLSELYLLEGVR